MSDCPLHSCEPPAAHKQGERRTLQVLLLTVVTMGVEIVAGFSFNSMALTADGWHMGTHAAAFGIAIFAYRYARKHANDPHFTFGTGKVGALGGFASAVCLAVVALLMCVESIHRLIDPQPIRFREAIAVAVLGLLVNFVCALLLKEDHHHAHAHPHHDHHHGQDHNRKAAYLHVLADALTSVTAIIALSFGSLFGWVVLDPLMGIIGSLVITKWAMGLLKETSGLLLDSSVDPCVGVAIRGAIEFGAERRVADLHVWAIAAGQLAVVLSVETAVPCTPENIKALLSDIPQLAHISVEVQAV